MMATILTFLPPEPQPAQQRPDDRERAMDRRIFYDEPHIHTLISLMDEKSRLFLLAAADRERSRLPLFPAHFMKWAPETGCLDAGSKSFDPGECSRF